MRCRPIAISLGQRKQHFVLCCNTSDSPKHTAARVGEWSGRTVALRTSSAHASLCCWTSSSYICRNSEFWVCSFSKLACDALFACLACWTSCSSLWNQRWHDARGDDAACLEGKRRRRRRWRRKVYNIGRKGTDFKESWRVRPGLALYELYNGTACKTIEYVCCQPCTVRRHGRLTVLTVLHNIYIYRERDTHARTHAHEHALFFWIFSTSL